MMYHHHTDHRRGYLDDAMRVYCGLFAMDERQETQRVCACIFVSTQTRPVVAVAAVRSLHTFRNTHAPHHQDILIK